MGHLEKLTDYSNKFFRVIIGVVVLIIYKHIKNVSLGHAYLGQSILAALGVSGTVVS